MKAVAGMMPLSFLQYVDAGDKELTGLRKRARLRDLTSDEALNLIIELYRRGDHNDLASLLKTLGQLR